MYEKEKSEACVKSSFQEPYRHSNFLVSERIEIHSLHSSSSKIHTHKGQIWERLTGAVEQVMQVPCNNFPHKVDTIVLQCLDCPRKRSYLLSNHSGTDETTL